MQNDSGDSIFSRPLGDFLSPELGEKAGIIEARLGPSPLARENGFAWPPSPAIQEMEFDSRKVKPSSLFFALPGLHVDGHDYIPNALDRGVAAIVHEKELAEYREGVLYIRVKDCRFAMSSMSDAFYDYPSRRMGVIGVTGTEGKSSTVYLIYQLLTLLGKKAGFISTVQHGDGLDLSWNSEHQTTPEAVTVQRLLAQMQRNGAEFAVLEASSHGLSKKTMRLGDVDFDAGVMTNVNHEHLEFHGSWEQYQNDKAELFRSLDTSPSSHRKLLPAGELFVPSFGVVNADDKSAEFFAAATKHKTYRYSTRGAKADLSLRAIKSSAGGNWYEVYVSASDKCITVRDQLPGAFNAGNVFAALLVISNLLSMDVETIIPLVPYIKPVKGRMTAIHQGQPFEVLVDYAHTPSSFETIFPPLRRQLNASGGRLISLFGSAGERDTQKRPLQGAIAARYCDIVILSDEDPRGEDPMTILEEIAAGFDNMIRDETLFLIPNRPQAIRKAFSLARKGDMVLLLGKGHENSIIYKDGPATYDEISEAQAALEEAGHASGK